jgi:hypothetical protein
MKFSLNTVKHAIIVLLCVWMAQGCKQQPANSVLSADDNGGYASDASRIEVFTDDAISLADVAGNFFNPTFIGSDCASVAVDTLTGPANRLTIRFGDNVDCVCLDGRKRRGNISITYSGRYLDTGSVHTIQFDNYFVDDYQVTGTIKYTRVDTTVLGQWYYRVTVNDSVTITPDQYVVWKGTLVRKVIAGSITGDRTDDVFSVSGDATLTMPNAHQYSFAIATPLQVATSYKFVEAGVVNIGGPSGVRVLNYGPGTQDNQAQVNIGLNAYPVTLTY